MNLILFVSICLPFAIHMQWYEPCAPACPEGTICDGLCILSGKNCIKHKFKLSGYCEKDPEYFESE